MKKLSLKELHTIVKYQHNIDALCNFIENTCNDEYERGFEDGYNCRINKTTKSSYDPLMDREYNI